MRAKCADREGDERFPIGFWGEGYKTRYSTRRGVMYSGVFPLKINTEGNVKRQEKVKEEGELTQNVFPRLSRKT